MPLIESQIVYLHDLQCRVYYADGTNEPFVIQAPNGDEPFSVRIAPIGESLYRDKNRNYRRGSREYRVYLIFDYSNHYMDLNKLFASMNIDINFDTLTLPFTNTKFKFNKESVTKNWFASVPVTSTWYTKEGANPYPSGETDLEFVSVETWSI